MYMAADGPNIGSKKGVIFVMQFRRTSALLLALVMLISLTLTGCGKKEPPIPGDQVAEAMADILVKNDVSKAMEVFGYTDEAEVRSNWGIDGDSIYTDEVVDELVSEFSNMGYKATAEEIRVITDAFSKLYKGIEFTARVKVADEETGVAVVTCTVNTVDSEAFTQAMLDAASELDPDLLAEGDMEDIYGQILYIAAANISEIKPTGRTVDYDVDFELSTVEICGKIRQVWVPKDAKEFGFQLTYHFTAG